MNKLTVTGVVVVLLLLAGGGALLANLKSSDSSSTKSSSAPASSGSSMHMKTSAPASSGSTATATNVVTIQNFAFSPANITIKKGTTVTWTNKDSTAHTVTETDGQNGPKSGNLANGQSFVFTFDNPGTYKYDCSIHKQMVATVTVTE